MRFCFVFFFDVPETIFRSQSSCWKSTSVYSVLSITSNYTISWTIATDSFNTKACIVQQQRFGVTITMLAGSEWKYRLQTVGISQRLQKIIWHKPIHRRKASRKGKAVSYTSTIWTMTVWLKCSTIWIASIWAPAIKRAFALVILQTKCSAKSTRQSI